MLYTDDLMSLLDAGVHIEDPSFVVDPEAIFSEDMFYSSQYGSLHRRSGSGARASRPGAGPDRDSERERDRDRIRDRDRDPLRRDRERWWSTLHVGPDSGPSSAAKPPPSVKSPCLSRSLFSDQVSVSDLMQWWPEMVRIWVALSLNIIVTNHVLYLYSQKYLN